MFVNTDVPGEYRIEVAGEGKDAERRGGERRGRRRGSWYTTTTLEMTRRAADHEFLKKLSAAGGGEFHLAKDLQRNRSPQQFQKQPQEKKRAAGRQVAELATARPVTAVLRAVFPDIRGTAGRGMAAAAMGWCDRSTRGSANRDKRRYCKKTCRSRLRPAYVLGEGSVLARRTNPVSVRRTTVHILLEGRRLCLPSASRWSWGGPARR